VERDLGFEVARVLFHPFQSRQQGISHLKVSHKATEMGRSSVLHKNLYTCPNILRRKTCKSVQYFLSYSGFKSHSSFSMTLYNFITKDIKSSDKLRKQVTFPVLVCIAPTALSRCLLRIKKTYVDFTYFRKFVEFS
jgi:hypothetical protein